ncbi:hypothetical protein M9435_002183 [Picochlorum sp. BPE23]|nr:hypothetical protein M9435_002183 [Picochlorum sp. BPE23]
MTQIRSEYVSVGLPRPMLRRGLSTKGQRLSPIAQAQQKPSITVLGGGVIGLTSALRIKQQYPDASVTIIGEKIATETTSEGAGGLWKPFALTGTPDSLVNAWGKETLDHYMGIYLSPDAPKAGIVLTSAYELFQEKVDDPAWATLVPQFRHLTEEEIAFYDHSGTHVHGIAYTTIIAEGRLYMQWVLSKLMEAGNVDIVRKRIERVSEIGGAQVVINCTGLGARELFNDQSMYGIRGHVLRVRAPWVRHHVESHSLDASKPAYIIPNTDTVVLGGTKVPGDEDTTSTEEERQEIFDRCQAIVPSLSSAEILSSWVGLRPGRNGIRLEAEMLDGTNIPVIHNYGHGGSGLTLAWGCAGNVLKLLQQHL